MTHEEFRQLDAEIAERVMGYTKLEWRDDGRTSQKQLMGVKPGERATASGYQPKYLVPAFSTEIAAAFQIVEALKRDLGCALQLWASEKNDIPGWYAHFTMKYWINNGYEGVKGQSASHAICLAARDVKSRWEEHLAALKAVGG